ncbi:hypothetical protein D9757_001967 [Collybiopsis confluens]|uniref:Hamartin n=1 Tax=Collybiopsis confluens TaxID=2823264 RepID=A0A8H5MEU3_9AGAR|nr:hypothetical protein D9757_001967 [Collybiopsis confluens]
MMTSINDLGRQLRHIFIEAPEAISLAELLSLVENLASSGPLHDDQAFSTQLELELSTIHSEFLDHSVLYHAQVLLAVLYHLRERLTPSTIITFWFDIVLRPALRTEKLATVSVGHAKELILCAMRERTEEESQYREKINEFRTRLFDLYLLDTLNEGSQDDLLEWTELDVAQREKKAFWKDNLEDILLKFADMCPDALLTSLCTHFLVPSSRLQLLLFLNKFITSDFEPSPAFVFILLQSLLYDVSTTTLSVALTILAKLLPALAVRYPLELKRMIPQLFTVFVRTLCWTGREQNPDESDREDEADDSVEGDFEEGSKNTWSLRPEILHSWERLDSSFKFFPLHSSLSSQAGRLFTYLYYLFPCNLLGFLRDPVKYLTEWEADWECPYIGGWAEILELAEIRTKSEYLIRGHICHPLLIWQTTEDELSTSSEVNSAGVFWEDYDVARIASEAMSLDLRYMNIALRERHRKKEPSISIDTPGQEAASNTIHEESRPRPSTLQKEIRRNGTQINTPRLSLQQMITTSVLLKSNMDIKLDGELEPWAKKEMFESSFFTVSWSGQNIAQNLGVDYSSNNHGSESVFEPDSPTPSSRSPTPTHTVHSSSETNPGLKSITPHEVSIPSLAMSALQREILILRTELHFQLWLSRENVKHIGRLYQDRVVNRNAEKERQGLYNKLRTYRSQVVRLETELQEAKGLAVTARQKHVDWSSELQGKLRDLREEKRRWVELEAGLRSGKRDVEAQLQAQTQLLSSANAEVFRLQTSIKENQHKIDRLKDYESQIEQGKKMWRIWDTDFEKFQRRGAEIDMMRASRKQMEIRVESLEKIAEEMERQVRLYRGQAQVLESQLSRVKQSQSDPPSRPHLTHALAALTAEKGSLMKANEALEEKNTELREVVEELEVMCEELRGKVRQGGLVYSNEEQRH